MFLTARARNWAAAAARPSTSAVPSPVVIFSPLSSRLAPAPAAPVIESPSLHDDVSGKHRLLDLLSAYKETRMRYSLSQTCWRLVIQTQTDALNFSESIVRALLRSRLSEACAWARNGHAHCTLCAFAFSFRWSAARSSCSRQHR